MRILPKKIKVKNTVYKCYSMIDVLVALSLFAIIFLLITSKHWISSIGLLLLTLVLFIPTQDGIFYEYILENIKFLFDKKIYLKDTDSIKENVSNILEYKDIDEDGVLSLRSGVYAKVLKIGQKNFGIEDVDGQNMDINAFANALKVLDENTSIDLVKLDKTLSLHSFAEEVFAKLKKLNKLKETKEIRLKKEILKSRINEIDKINNFKREYLSDFYIVLYNKSLADLDNLTNSFITEMAQTGLSISRLSDIETAIFLKNSLNRDFDPLEAKDKKGKELIEWVKPEKLEFKQNRYYIDNLESSIFTIAEYPLRVKNAWGANIFDIPNTKVVMHLSPIDKAKAIKRIDKSISDLETKEILSERASESNSAEIHKETMQGLLDSLQAENESLLDVTVTITVYNNEENPEFKKDVKRSLMIDGFKPSNLYGKQIEGFKAASILGPNKKRLRNYARGINSSSLAAVFPFVKTFVMDKGGVLLGEDHDNGYPFIFDLWKRGNLYQNSNAMVIGQSGSGKSYFLKSLIANEWADNVRVIILDPESEYVSIIKAMEGNLIDVGNAKDGCLNPFHIYKILTESGEAASSKMTFDTHLKMLESFFKIVLAGASNDVIEIINNLVVETYKRKGIDENVDYSTLKAEDYPIFSDLLETINNIDIDSLDSLSQRDYRSAKIYLEKFVTGRYSDIWNHPSTLKVDSSVIDFNFMSLFANKNNVVANAQMLLIFRFIEQEIINNRAKGEKVMIVTDEAHLFIDAKYPIALDFFYQMNKRIRKYGGSFIPATQNIQDWNASEELRNKTSTIIKNSQYTFIFKLTPPDMADVLDIYRVGYSFNEDEQRSIISALTGQTFFIGSSEERQSVHIKTNKKLEKLFEGGGENVHEENS